MILELDAGNTRLKWRVVDDHNKVHARGAQDYSVELTLISAQVKATNFSLVRIASVMTKSFELQVRAWVAKEFQVQIKFAQVCKHYAGIIVAYDDPSQLGVDRWLAMLAAYKVSDESVCIIDAGSALTVDLIAQDGQHLGGYIVPGRKILNSVLLKNTSQIKIDDQHVSNQLSWGKNTSEAVNHGSYRMGVSFIQSIVDELKCNGKQWQLYITGGDGKELMSGITTDFIVYYDPDLVFKGLAVAFPGYIIVS